MEWPLCNHHSPGLGQSQGPVWGGAQCSPGTALIYMLSSTPNKLRNQGFCQKTATEQEGGEWGFSSQ